MKKASPDMVIAIEIDKAGCTMVEFVGSQETSKR